MNEVGAALAFAWSLGLGLLLGLERERRPNTKAGLRTFALTAIFGTACALLAQQAGSGWLLAAGFLACAAAMIAADRRADEPADVTTTIALLLCFAYGAMLWHGYTHLTVALGLATTVLLYFKSELHEISHHLSRQDMVSFLQFAVITFIVLPILPDQGYGPYAALNPYRIWWMVVLIAGIGLAGYVALRFAGEDRGPPLLGFLGGLISSTATTLVYARKARMDPDHVRTAEMVVLVANLVLLLRVGFVAALVAPTALRSLALPLGLGLMLGSLALLRTWQRSTPATSSSSDLPAKNPVELGSALTFGAIYAVALIMTAWLNDLFGPAGIYGVAPALGLTDMDAITLSTLKLFGLGELTGSQVAIALSLALAANMVFKAGLARGIGGRALGAKVIAGFCAVLAGIAAGAAIAHTL